jgi:hypothetical protein
MESDQPDKPPSKPTTPGDVESRSAAHSGAAALHRPIVRTQDDFDSDVILRPLKLDVFDEEDELSRDMLYAAMANVESIAGYKLIESMRKKKELPPKRVAELKTKLNDLHTVRLFVVKMVIAGAYSIIGD